MAWHTNSHRYTIYQLGTALYKYKPQDRSFLDTLPYIFCQVDGVPWGFVVYVMNIEIFLLRKLIYLWGKFPNVCRGCMHSAHNISVPLHTQRTYKKGRGLILIGPVRNVQKQVLLYNSCQKTMHCNAGLLCLP